MKKRSLNEFVLLALFAAIIFVLGLTPLGLIPLGVIKATTIHIPVIIGSLLLGPVYGGILGGVFGLASLIANTTAPSLLSFCFSPLIPVPGLDRGSLLALVICFIPRILVGILPYYIFKLFGGKKERPSVLALGAAGFGGALVNTFFVMGGIYLIFGDAFASIKGIAADKVIGAIMGIVVANGIPEAVVSMILVTAICKPLFALYFKEKKA